MALACHVCLELIDGDACPRGHEARDPVELDPAQAKRAQELLQRLKRWRQQQARVQGVEPFQVFPNRTLAELAARAPATRQDLADVPGVGPVKLRHYAQALVAFFEAVATQDELLPEGPEIVRSPVPEGLSAEQEALLLELRSLRHPLHELAAKRGVSLDVLVEQACTLIRAGAGDVAHLLVSPIEEATLIRYLDQKPHATVEELVHESPVVDALAARVVRALRRPPPASRGDGEGDGSSGGRPATLE